MLVDRVVHDEVEDDAETTLVRGAFIRSAKLSRSQ